MAAEELNPYKRTATNRLMSSFSFIKIWMATMLCFLMVFSSVDTNIVPIHRLVGYDVGETWIPDYIFFFFKKKERKGNFSPLRVRTQHLCYYIVSSIFLMNKGNKKYKYMMESIIKFSSTRGGEKLQHSVVFNFCSLTGKSPLFYHHAVVLPKP